MEDKMLTFSEDYFKTENREGFWVNELMKRSWAAQLEVLNRIIMVCEKYHLNYYAYAGTLLGAVRHRGYIPWDDDLDLAMTREDYIRFLEVIREELPEEYCVLNSYTENEYDDIFTRITNRSTIDFSDRSLDEYHGCPFVVGVDVFPLYYVPRDEEDAGVQRNILQVISDTVKLLANINEENQAESSILVAEGMEWLQSMTGYQFTEEKPIRTQLEMLYDQIGRVYTEEESDTITLFPVYLKNGYQIPKEAFAERVQLPFENLLLSVPKGWDVLLRVTYGDYMYPQRMRGSHNYPFYKAQLELLGRYMEKQDLEWKVRCGQCLPQDWQEKIQDKKVILYHTGADALLRHGEYAVPKIRFVLDLFRESEDVVLWWFPDIPDNPKLSFLKKMSPELVEEYQRILEMFQTEAWGIYDATGDMQRAVSIADAYYGDEGHLLELFRETGKSAMLQDYEFVD